MTEVFRQRVEAPVTQETAPPQRLEVKSDTLAGNETKTTDPLTSEEQKLEIWEGLNRRKYVTEFFDIKNIEGEFNLKMQTSQIDKFIKGELEKRGYEKNTDNWKKVLAEVEKEIGSDRLELYKRLQKLTGYIQAVNRLNRAKELKEKYHNSIQ